MFLFSYPARLLRDRGEAGEIELVLTLREMRLVQKGCRSDYSTRDRSRQCQDVGDERREQDRDEHTKRYRSDYRPLLM